MSELARWTVNVGDDRIVIERDPDGTVVIDVPSKKPLKATRDQVHELRLKLGAAIVEPGES